MLNINFPNDNNNNNNFASLILVPISFTIPLSHEQVTCTRHKNTDFLWLWLALLDKSRLCPPFNFFYPQLVRLWDLDIPSCHH